MEDGIKNFINTVIFVSRIFSGLKDKFLARKLYDKLSDFVFCYASHNIKPGDLPVAVNNLLDLLDYLEYGKAVAITPLLYARRSLFVLKLQLMRNSTKPAELPGSVGMPISGQIVEKEKEAAFQTVPKIKKEIKMGDNKEKILNYIKRSPNSRTKEIVYEFNILSDRTVKRNLKELVDEGLVKKVSKNKAVYYHIS